MPAQKRNLRLALLACAAAALAGCGQGVRGFENATADLFASIEGLPREARELETIPLNQLACCAASGVQEYEIARRFELGVGGLPQDLVCALTWYERSGRAPVRIREPAPSGGFTETPYLGFPHARRAIRRLNDEGHALTAMNSAYAASRCRNLIETAVGGAHP